jgi:CheY-like chemotaxis protein
MSQSASGALHGLRVLVAEDNVLIGAFIRQILEDIGCAVVGPFEGLEEVLGAIRLTPIDGALLDLELDGVCVLPAASALAERGIPFILATGQTSPAGLPALLAGAPFLTKPFEPAMLAALVLGTFAPDMRRPLV